MTNQFDAFVEALLREMPEISLKGKTVMSDNSPLKDATVEQVKDNIVFIRNDKAGFLPEGFSLVYFMDSPEAAKRMASGQIPYKMIPRGTFMSGGSPIDDVWKKKHHLAGHEHVLGMIEANVMPDQIYIDMMSVRPKYQRNSINSKMIDVMRKSYPDAKIRYSSPTDKGKKFISGYSNK